MTPIYSPSYRNEYLALKAVEFEDERQREALRRFYQRERQPVPIPRKTLVQWAVLTAIAGTLWGFAISWIYPLLHKVVARLF